MVSDCYWKPNCSYPSEECNPKCNSYSPIGSTPSDLCDACARWDNGTDTCKSIEMCDYLRKPTGAPPIGTVTGVVGAAMSGQISKDVFRLGSAYVRRCIYSDCKHCDEHGYCLKAGECVNLLDNVDSQICKQDAHKPQLSLVPMQIVYDIAKVREHGNKKYGESDSWKRVEPRRYVNALLRHALALASDWESIDEESGLPHLWHLETNAAFLSAFMRLKDE